MAKFIRKIIVIDAEQFTPEHSPRGVYKEPNEAPYVVTIHGDKATVRYGDWIVMEPDGTHYYPVKDYIFETTYSIVQDCMHLPKTRVTWGPSGNRIPPEGKFIDPCPPVCEKCGVLIRMVWIEVRSE